MSSPINGNGGQVPWPTPSTDPTQADALATGGDLANPDGSALPAMGRDQFRRDPSMRDADGPWHHHPHHHHHGHHGRGAERFDGHRPGWDRGEADPAARADALFKKLDANGDGSVSKDEVQAFMQQRRSRLGLDHQDPGLSGLNASGATPSLTPASAGTTPAPDPGAPSPDPTQATGATAPSGLDLPTLKAQTLDQLDAFEQDPQFQSLSADQQAQVQSTRDQVNALDPADPDFMAKLTAIVSGS